MIALTTNPVDWALAVVIGIPVLIAAVSWLAVKAEEACPCEWCEKNRG